MEIDAKQTPSLRALPYLDALLVGLAFWLASFLRDPLREALGYPPMGEVGLGGLESFVFCAIPLAPIVLNLLGFYGDPLRQGFGDSLLKLIKAGIIVGVVIGVMVFLLGFPAGSRIVLGAAIPLVGVFLMGRVLLVRAIGRRLGP